MRSILATLMALSLLVVPVTAEEEIPDSGDIFAGETYSYTFTEVFEEGHTYHCHPHPWMWAMVHVFPEGTLSSQEPGVNTHHVAIVEGNISDQDTWEYTPQHLSIEVGDTVVWTNEGQLTHTVSPGNPDDDSDGHHHDHGDHGDEHHHDDDFGTPGFGAVAAIGGLLFVAFFRRN